jgi:hypothetical protein
MHSRSMNDSAWTLDRFVNKFIPFLHLQLNYIIRLLIWAVNMFQVIIIRFEEATTAMTFKKHFESISEFSS